MHNNFFVSLWILLSSGWNWDFNNINLFFLVKTEIVLTISSLFLNELIDQICQEMQQN